MITPEAIYKYRVCGVMWVWAMWSCMYRRLFLSHAVSHCSLCAYTHMPRQS
jgi:hypothetical protein